MAKLIIENAGYLFEAIEFAKGLSEEALDKFLLDIKYIGGDPKEYKTEVTLYPEINFGGPHSFGFTTRILGEDGNWKRGVNGGLIYHSGDKEWSVHT
jgi:hypothetical protein